MSWHNSKEYKCPHCIRSFAKVRQITSHVRDCHDLPYESGINCANCGTITFLNPESEWECPDCGYVEEGR